MEKINDTLNEMGIKTDLNKSLKDNYKKSLKNENFKDLVDKLKLSEDELMKYTSLLEESSCEYSNCKNCKNILECKNKLAGYAYLPKVVNNKLVFNYKACKYKEKLNTQNRFKSNITLYQTQDKILDANIKDIYSKDIKRYDAINYLMTFLKEYPNHKGLYLHGTFGSGKTYLITAILVELAKKDVKSTIVFWPEFLSELKSYFGDDTGYRKTMYQIKNTEILLIDDIGAENVTQWSRDEVLSPILQYRMDNKLKTFFTSNLNIEDLERHLALTKDGEEIVKARRIIERIKQLTSDVELVSKNLRN